MLKSLVLICGDIVNDLERSRAMSELVLRSQKRIPTEGSHR